MARMTRDDAALPSMNDHADALHPLTTQPERQMAPAEAARQTAAAPGATPADKGKAFMETWKQMSSVAKAKGN